MNLHPYTLWIYILTRCELHCQVYLHHPMLQNVVNNPYFMFRNVKDAVFMILPGIRGNQTVKILLNNVILLTCKDKEWSSLIYILWLRQMCWKFQYVQYIPMPILEFCHFYATGSNDRGHIVFVLSVCLSVCLFVCLSVVNFNIRYNFWTVRGRDFIFCMHTSLMIPFQMTPRSMTLWPWLWPLL